MPPRLACRFGRVTLPRIISIIILHLLILPDARAQVVINEIMHSPIPPEPEWIELFNAGSSPVDLDGWTIFDASGNGGALVAVTIPAGGYLVVTRDTAALKRERQVGSTLAEAQLPSLNNSGDAIILRALNGLAADSVAYRASWGGNEGGSLERRRHDYPSSRDTTWENSASRSGATPGKKNATTPATLDAGIDGVRFDAVGASVTVVIGNNGDRATVKGEAILYHDANDDGEGGIDEEIAKLSVAPIAAGGSATIRLEWSRPLLQAGEPGLVELRMAGEERPLDNIVPFTAILPAPDTGMVISEIMFDPVAVDGRSGAEYVELHNRSDHPIEIGGWRIYDATLKPQLTVRSGAPPVAPRSYLLLASDSAIFLRFPHLRDSTNVILFEKAGFALNADEEEIALRDAAGALVDQLHYRGDWHRPELGEMKGIALERISMSAPTTERRNWSSSAAPLGGTPGARNSVDIPIISTEAALAAIPPILSPDGDGRDDFTRLRYHLPVRIARIIAVAYDRYGRPVRRLASNELAAAEGELIWDGRDDAGRSLDPGIYLVRLEGYDDDGGSSFAMKGTVVIARKL